MLTALFVSHSGERCGVYQFGQRLFEALAAESEGRGGALRWTYVECGSEASFVAAATAIRPQITLFNYHPHTLGWAEEGHWSGVAGMTFAVYHEIHQTVADALHPAPFDVMLCPDPTLVTRNPSAIRVPRFIPTLPAEPPPAPARMTIGSFGFATPNKGFARLCALVDGEFEDALIRINLPPHDCTDVISAEMAAAVEASCRAAITKPGITLEVTRRFMTDRQLLDFLASNTLNAFLYEDRANRGISSCVDYALACGRPVAISRSTMFRHLHGVNPSICVEDRPLSAIATSGTAPLLHHIREYESATAGATWTRLMLAARASRDLSASLPDGRGFNKVLGPRSRTAYERATDGAPGPEADTREAKVEQLFAIDAVPRLSVAFEDPRILFVGHPDDATLTTLRQAGYRIDLVDFQGEGTGLSRFFKASRTVAGSYDIVAYAPLLRREAEDADRVRMVGDLLAPGGVALFVVATTRRTSEPSPGPGGTRDTYSIWSHRERIMASLPDFGLLDPPNDDDDLADGGSDPGDPDGHALATLVVRKFSPHELRRALPALARGRDSAWKRRRPIVETRRRLLSRHGRIHRGLTSHFGPEIIEAGDPLFRVGRGQTGYLLFGPYLSLEPGEYEGTILVRLDQAIPEDRRDAGVATIDVAWNRSTAAGGYHIHFSDLVPGEFKPFSVAFTLTESTRTWEIRFFVGAPVRMSAVALVALRPKG